MASATGPNPITITTLRGGLNDNDPPMILSDDACTIAENVEFFYSTIGERRLGCAKISDLPTSISSDSNIETISWFGRHYPDNDLTDVELWVLAQNLTGSNYVLTHRTKSAWSTVTPDDAITVTTGRGHRLSAVSLHGKFYIAYKSSVDKLHVWDGTHLRVCGLAAPAAAPTAADTGVGTYSGIRYFRTREVVVSGSSVLLRSEASAVLTFTPSGTGNGALITKPATVSSYATHWEVEASTDNSNFYRISRVAIGTTTYTDTVVYASGYANAIGSILSESATAYTQIPSGKFLTVDQDRLIIGGSWENSAYSSRIWWTPVLGDTGTGNDERLDMTVNPFIDLDGYEGGEITGISRAVNGYLYAFKWSHIYKVVRTGQRTSAYSAIPLTKARGAIPGSLVEAVDQTGSPAQYFIDPKVGPMRIGQYGLEWCSRDLRTLWSRINLSATVIAHGVFYQSKNQVHYWLALDGSNYPNAKIVLQCNEMRSFSIQSYGSTLEGGRRGWSTVPVGNRIAAAHCSIMFDDNLSTTDPRSQNLVPYIGKEQWTVGASTIKDLIQECDTGTSDAYTSSDTDAYYYAKVQTKPYLPLGLLARAGVSAATIMATSINSPTNDVYLKITRDFGLEDKTIAINLTQLASEDTFIRELDDATMRESSALQFTFGDLNTDLNPSTSWRLHAFFAKTSQERSQ